MADKPIKFTTITNAGVQLVKQLAAKSNTITAFRAVGSSASHWNDSLDIIRAMTDIDAVEQNGVYMGNFNSGDNIQTVQIDFNQQELTESYELATVGLFATDGDKKEILYAIECLQTAQPMTPSTEHDVSTHNIQIAVGNTDQVIVQFTEAGTVSQAELTERLQDYTRADEIAQLIADNIPSDIITQGNAATLLPANLAKTDTANTFSGVQTFKGGALDPNGLPYINAQQVPKIDLSPYALNADMLTKLATKVDTSDMTAKLALKADLADMTTKLAAKADTATVNQQIGTRMAISSGNVSTTSFDDMKTDGIWAINNLSPANVKGFPTELLGTSAAWGKLVVLSAGSSMIRQILYSLSGQFVYRSWTGSPGAWSGWQRVATSDDVTAAINALRTELNNNINTAKQAAINQIQPLINAEFTKRNAPSAWWNGTAAQYAAVNPKVASVEYNVYE